MKKKVLDVLPYLITILLVVLIRTFLVSPIRVNGSSMLPTLKNGNIMLLNKIALKNESIKRFELVVFKNEHKLLIKRVIGLPGERIECLAGVIYINDEPIKDEYGTGWTSDFKTIKLHKNEYFVMGDNRSNSKDSRIIGPVNKSIILGKTKTIIFPFNKFGKTYTKREK